MLQVAGKRLHRDSSKALKGRSIPAMSMVTFMVFPAFGWSSYDCGERLTEPFHLFLTVVVMDGGTEKTAESPCLRI